MRRFTVGSIALLAVFTAAGGDEPPKAFGEGTPKALLTVKTLVVDGMGTRTVSADTARVPLGSKGLLLRQVPYAGPPLSYRLAVTAGAPGEDGFPLTAVSEVWSGGLADEPAPSRLSRREERAVLARESSYLLELDHDPRADRRVLLSISVTPLDSQAGEPPAYADPGPPLQFHLEITREAAGVADPPDSHLLTALPGMPISYSSGVRRPGSTALIGLSVTVQAEQILRDLVTVSVQLEGSDYADEKRLRLEPIRESSMHTVRFGSSFDVAAEVPGEAGPDGLAKPAVRYVVKVTPILPGMLPTRAKAP